MEGQVLFFMVSNFYRLFMETHAIKLGGTFAYGAFGLASEPHGYTFGERAIRLHMCANLSALSIF